MDATPLDLDLLPGEDLDEGLAWAGLVQARQVEINGTTFLRTDLEREWADRMEIDAEFDYNTYND